MLRKYSFNYISSLKRQGSGSVLNSRIRICIKMKSRIRIRIKVKSRIRIRIKVKSRIRIRNTDLKINLFTIIEVPRPAESCRLLDPDVVAVVDGPASIFFISSTKFKTFHPDPYTLYGSRLNID
jgi:hypothetical protein